MKNFRLVLLGATLALASCATQNDRGTISQLKDVNVDLKDEKIEGGIEKAMAGYQKFLQETPESAMTPEAIRRLADLKIEKEYGVVEGAGKGKAAPAGDKIDRPEGFDAKRTLPPVAAGKGDDKVEQKYAEDEQAIMHLKPGSRCGHKC